MFERPRGTSNKSVRLERWQERKTWKWKNDNVNLQTEAGKLNCSRGFFSWRQGRRFGKQGFSYGFICISSGVKLGQATRITSRNPCHLMHLCQAAPAGSQGLCCCSLEWNPTLMGTWAGLFHLWEHLLFQTCWGQKCTLDWEWPHGALLLWNFHCNRK